MDTLLSTIGLVNALGVFGVAITAFLLARGVASTVKRLNAESAFVEALQRDLAARSAKLQKKSKQNQADLLAAYRQEVERALRVLPASQRGQILEALEQPSKRGQENYLRKLISEIADQSGGDIAPHRPTATAR